MGLLEMPPMSHLFSFEPANESKWIRTGWLGCIAHVWLYGTYKKWMYMFHGNIFIRYNNQTLATEVMGDTKVDAPNWFMAGGSKTISERIVSFQRHVSL